MFLAQTATGPSHESEDGGNGKLVGYKNIPQKVVHPCILLRSFPLYSSKVMCANTSWQEPSKDTFILKPFTIRFKDTNRLDTNGLDTSGLNEGCGTPHAQSCWDACLFWHTLLCLPCWALWSSCQGGTALESVCTSMRPEPLSRCISSASHL